MGSKRKHQGIYSLVSEKSLLDLFERDGQQLSRWSRDAKDFIGELGYLFYDTPADALDVLTKYSQNLRKAAQGTQPIVDFINAKLRKKKQPINKIINDNLKELCPLINVKYTSVSPTTKPAKGKQGRQEIINRIFMRYSRAKK